MKILRYQGDNHNRITYFNAALNKDLFAVTGNENLYTFVGRQNGILFSELIHPDYLDEFKQEFSGLKQGSSARLLNYIRDFSDQYYLCDITIINNGRLVGGAPVFDITVYIIDTIEYWYNYTIDTLNKYRSFLSIYQDYLMDYDSETGIICIYLYMNNKSTPFIRCSIEEFYNKIRPAFTTREDIDKFEIFYHNILDASENFNCSLNMPVLNDSSSVETFSVTARLIHKRNQKPVIIAIFKQLHAGDKVYVPYYATNEGKDSATGLLNKRASSEYTADILKMHDNLMHYMIIIDIDNFKDINDSYGHLFGDEVILNVASTMNSILDGRGIAGRFGGDEFYMFTTNINDENALRTLLTTIRRNLYYSYEDRFSNLHVTLSIGVSLCPNDGTTYEDLFRKADRCLYIAKQKGKNRFVIYNEEMHGNISDSKERLQRRLDPLEKAEYLALVMVDYCSILNNKGSDAIPSILESVVTYFELDGIRIYNGNSGSLLAYNGDYKSFPDITDIFKDEQFISHFNDNHLLMIGSTANFEFVHTQFSKEMVRCNIIATACYSFNNSKGEPVFFFYDLFNRAVRWIESDKNYLLMLSKMIAEHL